MFTAKCFIKSASFTCVCVCVCARLFFRSLLLFIALVPSHVRSSLLFLSAGLICDALCYIVFICVIVAYLFSQWFQHFLFLVRFYFDYLYIFLFCSFHAPHPMYLKVCIVWVRQAKALHSVLFFCCFCSANVRVKTSETIAMQQMFIYGISFERKENRTNKSD